ncbi:MAG: hypothetical protein J5685_03370, partial [Clostridiales bacterium]|nr:hypothetical protein [Clostridiales bacterium]
KIRSITLWSGDELEVITSKGTVRTKLGVELYETGKIRSIEPVFGTVLKTPYGEIRPFVYKIHMLHAEDSSLKFSEEGELIEFGTLHTTVDTGGTEYRSEGYLSPLIVSLGKGDLTIKRSHEKDIRIDTSIYEVRFR